MLVGHLLHRLGNQRAIDNARLASIELSRRRVELEAVEIFLEGIARGTRAGPNGGRAVAGR